jgi:hypothetical protein
VVSLVRARRHRGGAQRADQPAVAVTSLARFAFTGRFVVTGTHSGPGRQVCRGPEAAHVPTGFGDDDLRHGLADTWDRRQLVKSAGERAHLLLDP